MFEKFEFAHYNPDEEAAETAKSQPCDTEPLPSGGEEEKEEEEKIQIRHNRGADNGGFRAYRGDTRDEPRVGG